MDDDEHDNGYDELQQHDDAGVHGSQRRRRPLLHAHPVRHEVDVLAVVESTVDGERHSDHGAHHPGAGDVIRTCVGQPRRSVFVRANNVPVFHLPSPNKQNNLSDDE